MFLVLKNWGFFILIKFLSVAEIFLLSCLEKKKKKPTFSQLYLNLETNACSEDVPLREKETSLSCYITEIFGKCQREGGLGTQNLVAAVL